MISPEFRPLFRALINRWHPDRTRLASKMPLFEALTHEILSAYESGDIDESKRIDRDGLDCLHIRFSNGIPAAVHCNPAATRSGRVCSDANLVAPFFGS